MDNETSQGPVEAGRKRRPYRAPLLTTFGSVEEFTRGTGTGKADTPFPGRVKN